MEGLRVAEGGDVIPPRPKNRGINADNQFVLSGANGNREIVFQKHIFGVPDALAVQENIRNRIDSRKAEPIHVGIRLKFDPVYEIFPFQIAVVVGILPEVRVFSTPGSEQIQFRTPRNGCGQKCQFFEIDRIRAPILRMGIHYGKFPTGVQLVTHKRSFPQYPMQERQSSRRSRVFFIITPGSGKKLSLFCKRVQLFCGFGA